MSYQDEKSGEDQNNDEYKHGGAEATGRGNNFSFEEALVDAIGNRPPLGGADRLDTVKVVDIRAEFGGFVGTRTLIVKIRRVGPS
ncbi:MAG TPA: hypothetical protein VGE04_10190 [Chloroflexia bacterium]|jgi:hypothetical protein